MTTQNFDGKSPSSPRLSAGAGARDRIGAHLIEHDGVTMVALWMPRLEPDEVPAMPLVEAQALAFHIITLVLSQERPSDPLAGGAAAPDLLASGADATVRTVVGGLSAGREPASSDSPSPSSPLEDALPGCAGVFPANAGAEVLPC